MRTIATFSGSGDEGGFGIAGEPDQVLDDRAVLLINPREPRVLKGGGTRVSVSVHSPPVGIKRMVQYLEELFS
jgi:hypothetical protein